MANTAPSPLPGSPQLASGPGKLFMCCHKKRRPSLGYTYGARDECGQPTKSSMQVNFDSNDGSMIVSFDMLSDAITSPTGGAGAMLYFALRVLNPAQYQESPTLYVAITGALNVNKQRLLAMDKACCPQTFSRPTTSSRPQRRMTLQRAVLCTFAVLFSSASSSLSSGPSQVLTTRCTFSSLQTCLWCWTLS